MGWPVMLRLRQHRVLRAVQQLEVLLEVSAIRSRHNINQSYNHRTRGRHLVHV